MTKREIIKKVTAIILEHAKPERIYLYGSRATGDGAPTSDIDIAFDDPDFKKTHLIKEEVEKIPTLLKIDIVNLTRTEERFRKRIAATGKVLYSANKQLRAEDSLLNFSNALERFASAVDRRKEFYEKGDDDIYLDLAVKRFEFTYEMSWKAIKRYLDFTGIGCVSPRSCYKEAFAQGIITEEDVWLDMIEMRNLASHTYNEEEIKEIIDKLDRYTSAFTALKQTIAAALATEKE